jgi:hypothetical protein
LDDDEKEEIHVVNAFKREIRLSFYRKGNEQAYVSLTVPAEHWDTLRLPGDEPGLTGLKLYREKNTMVSISVAK